MRYVDACDTEAQIARSQLGKNANSDLISDLGRKAKAQLQKLPYKDLKHCLTLPQFLRQFTEPWVLTRCVWHRVDILQKLRQYRDANVELMWLLNGRLNSAEWLPDYRGRWWDRLVLNLDVHLKAVNKALEQMAKACEDPLVRDTVKLALYDRFQRLKNQVDYDMSRRSKKKVSPKKAKLIKTGGLANVSPSFDGLPIPNPPEITISGELLHKNLGDGRVTRFVLKTEDFAVCSVETVALHHYKTSEGFVEGLHGESKPWHTVLALLFWDVLFDRSTVKGVWPSRCQVEALDLNFRQFFSARSEEFENGFDWLATAAEKVISAKLQENWNKYHGVTCSLGSWDVFQSAEQAMRFVICVGRERLASIARHMFADYRHRRSGFPDLVLWNFEQKIAKVVEVKGPNDKLSTKQRLWLDFMEKVGLDVEVCHVEVVQFIQ